MGSKQGTVASGKKKNQRKKQIQMQKTNSDVVNECGEANSTVELARSHGTQT
jgi:hypothetical protein